MWHRSLSSASSSSHSFLLTRWWLQRVSKSSKNLGFFHLLPFHFVIPMWAEPVKCSICKISRLHVKIDFAEEIFFPLVLSSVYFTKQGRTARSCSFALSANLSPNWQILWRSGSTSHTKCQTRPLSSQSQWHFCTVRCAAAAWATKIKHQGNDFTPSLRLTMWCIIGLLDRLQPPRDKRKSLTKPYKI